ncbi:MAG: hypothetical protein IJT70_00325 [Clostridia bacterium]|nr:hypothetical protein [Clostridia bacterium]
MRKIISIFIVAVMIAAAFAAAIPVGARDGAEFDEVDALYFDSENKPTFDGIVSEKEWGTPTVVVRQSDAATADDTSPKNNRYFALNTGVSPRFDASQRSMLYTMWFRWDEDYFYIAVKVQDPDGHSLKNGRKNTWNGDAFQARIDSYGPNATSSTGDPYDYDASTDGKPWHNEKTVPDICAGFVQCAGGFSEAWNNAMNSGMTPVSGGRAKVEIAPSEADFSDDTSNGITTYELAIPWGNIDDPEYVIHDATKEFSNKNPTGALGREYGISTVVYNADGGSGAVKWNAGLGWGSGIINEQQNDHPGTCDGSNSVTLSKEKVNQEKPFPASAPYSPPVPEFVYPKSIDESVYKKLTYDNESDLDVFGYLINAERVKDSDGNWVIRYDRATDDMEEVYEVKDGSGNVIDRLNAQSELNTDGLDGATKNFYGPDKSYTMEFDFKILGKDAYQIDAEGPRKPYIGNCFAGPDLHQYVCAYYLEEGKFAIRDVESGYEVASAYPPSNLEEGWHHWVFQYFAPNQEIRLYIDPVRYTDPSTNALLIDMEQTKAVFAQTYRYFDIPGVKDDGCFPILYRMNCQIMLDNVEFYNYVDLTGKGLPPTTHTETSESTEVVPTVIESPVDFTVTERDDGTFALGIPNKDAYKAASVTAISFTLDLTKAEGKLSYKGLDGVDEGNATATDNGDGTVTVKIRDLKIFKDIETGKAVFSFIVEPKSGEKISAKDVKEKYVSITDSVTTMAVQTGDMMPIYVALAVLIYAIAATGAILMIRRRRRREF